MKYCVLGAGGCGASIAGYLERAGMDVTLIARGAHGAAIRERGLILHTTADGELCVPVQVAETDSYEERPDVVFVCVKSYSIPDVLPFLQRVTGTDTVVIPILNGYGVGERLQQELPGRLVTDSCIYIAAYRSAVGEITIGGAIFRIVYGVRDVAELTDQTARVLFETAKDLRESGIEVQISEEIRRDTLLKFSMVSPMAACGLYYNCHAEAMQRAGEERLLFEDLVREIEQLAAALGHPFLVDAVKTNRDILDGIAPDSAASVQREIWAGQNSEIETFLVTPIRLAREVGFTLPHYEMVAEKLKEQGLLSEV